MATNPNPGMTQAQPKATAKDAFHLDVELVEVGDAGALKTLTDDGCGSTCGACTTGVH
ncbi:MULTISPECIES: FxLD family lanthipeptide [Streptomyces]|uniref:FxLD family lanthipeptide n=1 Tax=Streptomyces flavotricini TaxID=66888 RepID=A0ABS8E218_9ACTN|nr:FxLD family lanthipeptide [Streptomyces flavotricini]MCC0094627.1 FxLD family lanthipeptide [Streptomyces flavotricini]